MKIENISDKPHSVCRKHGYTEDVIKTSKTPKIYRCRICRKKQIILFHKKNPEYYKFHRKTKKGKASLDKAIKKFRETSKYKQYRKSYNDEATKKMPDSYIKSSLVRNTKLTRCEIPVELIQLKRQQILLKRAAKENQ